MALSAADPQQPENPLCVALSAVKPIPANAAEDCQACRRALLLEADLPPTGRRSEKEIARLLALLDQLETERTGG